MATLVDLVKIVATTTGDGPITLGQAVAGFRGSEALVDGQQYSYSIQQGATYEYGRCTYVASGPRIVRSPLGSSLGGAPIPLTQNAQISFVALSEDLDAITLSNDAIAAAAAAAESEAAAAASATDAAYSLSQLNNQVTLATEQANAAGVSASAAAASAGSVGFLNAVVSTGGTPPYTVTGITAGSAGSGATVSGEFDLVISGGPAGHQAKVTVSGGAITGYRIVSGGLSTSNTAPTYTLPTIAGLSGATAPTATVGALVNGQTFTARSSDNSQILFWQIASNVAAPINDGSGNQLNLPTSVYVASIRNSYVRIVQTYGDRGSIPTEQRYGGMIVYVVEDDRWFQLSASDLTNTGWKTPAWLTPLLQGTIAERNNRIGGYDGWPTRGMRFLQTDVQPNVLWEYRLAGDPSGPFADSPAMEADDWVVVPQASEALGLQITSFEARALSSGANPVVDLRWSIIGTQPTTQTVSWGMTSVVLPGDVTSYSPKDWSTPQSLFVAGNSLSDSTDESTTRWSALLAADLGVPLYSVARYSSDWRQVYRAGVVPLYLTISGGVLPAGGTPASVSLINGRAPSRSIDADTGNPASFLNVGDAGIVTGLSMTGTIIDGANTRRVTVSIPNGDSLAYSIVAEAGSAALTLSGAVRFIPDIAKHMQSSTNIIWIGNNYFYSGQPGEFGDHVNFEMHRDMALLVAGAQGNRTLILPVIPSTTMALGSEVYNAMLAANARTEALYPKLYARSTDGRDLLKYLQDHGDGSANDNSDIANGWTPRSLRRTGDTLHLNSAGDAVVAAFVQEALARQALPSAITADTVFSLTATGSVTYGVGYETETASTSDTAVATLSAAPAAYLPAIASNSKPSVSGPALWFKTAPGSTIATLWVKAS